MDLSSIDDDTLLRRAVENARPRQRKTPRWVVVMELFGLGSTSRINFAPVLT